MTFSEIQERDHSCPKSRSDGPNLEVSWTSNRSVVLTHHPKTHVLKAEAKVYGVQISYVTAE